ncbi:hypothetical protein [Planctomycetes bacterium Poly30]|uniref:hypothetical protein n=1 Tax=Saltatorellus ferox TaxID=2528018 RepID=UPI0011A44474
MDRVIVLALLAGGWWALFLGELVDGARHRRALDGLSAPDWDIRATAFSPAERSLFEGLAPGLPPEPYPRALRQARGIGRKRALDLARYYQRAGPRAPADALHGIGSTTARAAAEAVSKLLAEWAEGQATGLSPMGLRAPTMQPPE